MSTTKLFHPYTSEKREIKAGRKSKMIAKATLRKTGPGVYMIYTKNWAGLSKLVYIGFASVDVRGVMYRHFQKWTDKRHPSTKRVQRIERVTYAGPDFVNADYKCKVLFCRNAAQAERIERALIRKHAPRDNAQKLAFDSEAEYFSAIKESEAMTARIEPDALEDLPF